ncbi:unnamed protein product [Paramecium octaurelia]|uniref:Transmembrane protein n=1 Tax=Paramecium octaurelia TaxID=43137 RepID=A0A8S1WAN6_PAROT|nr:unnamed protein product [Paramecium octaurelia]
MQQCHQFCKTCFGLHLLSVQLAIIFQISKKKNQHVNVKHALESYQMAVQLAILFKIEYQKDQNVSVLQDIMNQVNCPDAEDLTLSQCYKLCNNNQQIWHNITCNSCDIGFQLVSGECQTICGDLQIIGDELCEDNNAILNDLCYNCQFQCPAHCLTCDSSTTLPCPDVCGDGIITGIEDVKMEIYSILKTVKIEIYLIFKIYLYKSMMDTINIVNFNVNRIQYARVVLKTDANNVLMDICSLMVRFVLQYVKIHSKQLVNSAKMDQYYQIKVVTIVKRNANHLVLIVIKKINNLCYSTCGDKIVTQNEKCDDGNLIFEDGCHQCLFSCPILLVQFVFKVFVMIAMMVISILIFHASKFKIKLNMQDARCN